ncbi:hypothetical protein IPJ91_01670 [bacterium]|nr:MAG: hypothetical protein IPJ91_01670 [bacterium]
MKNKAKIKTIKFSILSSRILSAIIFFNAILTFLVNKEKYLSSLSFENYNELFFVTGQFIQVVVSITVLLSYSWISEWFLKIVEDELHSFKVTYSDSPKRSSYTDKTSQNKLFKKGFKKHSKVN